MRLTRADISTGGRFLCFFAAAMLGFLACATLAWAGEGSDGDGDCDPPKVAVKGTLTITNTTGRVANDFHFYMYQNDRPNVHVTGAKASSDSFSDVDVTMDTDNGQPDPPPPGNHGAQVDMTGGDVQPGETIQVRVMLCMNEKNSIKLKDIEWTFEADPGPPHPIPWRGGWRILPPFPGGNGGNPFDPSGGGRGAQAGGGGTGNWVHVVCIENDDDTLCMELVQLKLVASMEHLDEPDIEIDWDSIDPIENAWGEPAVIIPPGGRWCYYFETRGAYIDGHVYSNMDAEFVPCPNGKTGENEQGAGSGSAPIIIGDHPNPVESVDLDAGGVGDTLWDDWEWIHDLCTIDDGSGAEVNGPEGDPDDDELDNWTEQYLGSNPLDPNDPRQVPIPFCTVSALADFSRRPHPADFFGPGSEPFTGVVALTGEPVDWPSCDLCSDTIVQRPQSGVQLPTVGGGQDFPIELVALNLVSVEPITVTFAGGGTSSFDVHVGLNPSMPSTGWMGIFGDHLNGGSFYLYGDMQYRFTFTEAGNSSATPLVFDTMDSLYTYGMTPWQGFTPQLECPDCMEGGFVPGFDGHELLPIDWNGQIFHQQLQSPCEPTIPGEGDILPGVDLLEIIEPTTYYVIVDADFFGAGSMPVEIEVDFVGEPIIDSPSCPGDLGDTSCIIERLASCDATEPGETCTIPAEITDLSLRSLDPITVTIDGFESFFDVFYEISPSAPATGRMTITNTNEVGGTFDAEFFVVPQFTFIEAGNPSNVFVLDGWGHDIGTFLQVEDVLWSNDPSGLGWPNCSSNFVPGVCSEGPPSCCREPFTLEGCAGMLTCVPADLTESPDCNENGIPDECEIDDGTVDDCNANGVPDECEIDAGTADDCNENGIPDECEIDDGTVDDCNENGIPDECDIEDGTSLDCNGNGVPDECEPDCNVNGIPDECDIDDGTSLDCNENGIPDECDIEDGTSGDINENGVPDECEGIGEITVTVEEGPLAGAVIHIPSGALDEPTIITIEVDPDPPDPPAGTKLNSPAMLVAAPGKVAALRGKDFVIPVDVTLPLPTAPDDEDGIVFEVAYYNTTSESWESDGIDDVTYDSGDKLVSFTTTHFTTFAILTVKGDVNYDGAKDALDVQLVINAALGIDIEPLDANVNNDPEDKVDALDVQLTINGALGIAI